MSKSEKNTFYGSAAVLTASALVTKILGALCRIPLGNILPDEVMADYSSAYDIYNVLLTISTAGLPVAVSKCIAESNALGRRNQTMKVFRVSLATLLSLGLLGFLCMTVLSIPLSNFVLGNPKAVYCVLALSPSVLLVCLMSPIRGYFQGNMNMWPTGISQVIESFLKLVVGLALAAYLVNVAGLPEFGSVGALIGISISSVVALIYLAWEFFRARREGLRYPARDVPDSSKRIFKTLMTLAIPITIGSAASSLVSLIDGKLVMEQLRTIFETVDGLGEEAALDAARGLKGIYNKAQPIYNLPFSMMVPLTACIVPAISACMSKRDRQGAQRISESALRVGMLLALPMGMGLFALGGPIMGLLFPAVDVEIAGPLLSVLGLASILVSLQLLCNSILQANGMVNLPILAVVIGGVVKIIVNYILVGNPDIRINGAPVGTLCCFAVICALEIFIIRRAIPAAPRFGRALAKPLVASAIMAAAVWATHGLLSNVLKLSSRLAAVPAILVGVAVYLVLVLALRAITREDLSLMPKGDKIARILHIR